MGEFLMRHAGRCAGRFYPNPRWQTGVDYITIHGVGKPSCGGHQGELWRLRIMVGIGMEHDDDVLTFLG